MNEEYTKILYSRAIEIQPQLGLLVQDFKAMGMSEEDIAIELSFAMLHEGYRIRCLEQHLTLKPYERRLQTHVDDSMYKNSNKNVDKTNNT